MMATSTTSSSSHSPSSSPTLQSSPYPFAFAPDIIRAHQKDVYFQGLLTNQLTDLHRRLLGARSAHAWGSEASTIADLLYLCLTTLLGNRTLGEEYCDLVQVEGQTGALPSLPRRSAYIAGSILLPYALAKVLPRVRARIRTKMESNLSRLRSQGGPKMLASWKYRAQAYLLAHLSSITSPAPVHALGLALFYFSGSYYELAKRLTGLRYIFTRRVEETSDRAGYEVLGVLMVLQMSVQAWLHVRSTLSGQQTAARERNASSYPGVDVSLDENAYSSNNALLSGAASQQNATRIDVRAATHTPVSARPHYDLVDEATMGWVKGAQQRKCTLCLEELKDPAATQCGHVFCWVCIGDWVREKPECPLCRRECMVQHILPLRAY